VAFILLLLVGISLPIVKAVYLLSLQANVSEDTIATDVATELRFGVWGVCATRSVAESNCKAHVRASRLILYYGAAC
jgi:hypothetical protein